MKIAFLIRSLVRAGAEGQLVTLARGLARAGHDVRVAVFYGGGELEPELAASSIALSDLRKTGRWDVRFLARLARFVGEWRPDVLYCFMPGANLAAVPLRALFPRLPIVWGIRDSSTEVLGTRGLARASVHAQHRLARVPSLIVTNSNAGRDYNVAHGFPADRTIVIPNGIDTERFRPDDDARARMRAEWGLAPGLRLVGLVARLDSTKDHPTFLRAAGQIAGSRSDVRFVCVGGGPPKTVAKLGLLASELGLGENRLVWAGHRTDMPAVHNALDIGCSTSVTEAFPNALAEAMACGVPCVVTDVGDSSRIVGETGLVVPAAKPAAFADAALRMLTRVEVDPQRARAAARDRIVREFAIDACVRRTLVALERVVNGGSHIRGERRAQAN